jgi:DNA-directed RNA polymerase specialized sigma24 family protein
MFVPEGYTEDEVMAAIEKSLNSLVSNFSFGYYDKDDMYQEGFIFAHEALPKYDPDNTQGCSLASFLRMAIRSRFLSLRRDKFHRNTPPCSTCVFKADDADKGCKEFDDKYECPKWSGWNARNQAKRSLVESCDVEKITNNTPIDSDDVCTSLSRAELVRHISSKIPLALRADYRRLLDGAKLNKGRTDKVLAAVRDIVGELTNGKEIEAWSG